MSKAFDSLCHNFDMKNLIMTVYSRVKLGTIRSEWSKMSRGCPQGSSSGTLLWNAFQNDMTLLVKDTNLFMHVYDHQLYVTGSDYNTASSKLQYQGEIAMSWHRNSSLLANTEKFQCLAINPRNNDSDQKIISLPTLRKSNYLELK